MQDAATQDAFGVERAGSLALSVFARVLNAHVLHAHADGPLSSGELEERMGWAPKASLRVATANLGEIGALERAEGCGDEQGAITRLAPAGHGLLGLTPVLERWLSQSPFGPIPIAETAARGVFRALVAGWDSAIVQSIAKRPRSLAELDSRIDDHSYPALKRRLAKLRSANLAEPVEDRNRRSPAHGATDWLRCAVGPLVAAGRWELDHRPPQAEPLSRLDIEAMFMLSLPLVELPQGTTGSCALASLAPGEADEAGKASLAAVEFVVEEGAIVSSNSGVSSDPSTWALGTPDAWLAAIVDGEAADLRVSGAQNQLVTAVVRGIHEALFSGDGTVRKTGHQLLS